MSLPFILLLLTNRVNLQNLGCNFKKTMNNRYQHLYFLRNRNFNKWLGFVIALLIVVLTIWVSNSIVHKLKKEEQKKMETIVKATELLSSVEISEDTRALSLKIIEDNTSMPMLWVDEEGNLSEVRNLDNIEEKLYADSIYLKQKLKEMSSTHEPIDVELPFGTQKIYYENSSLLSQLRYYPIALVAIILAFAAFTIWYFRTLDESQKSFLWAGMAKETAHQIGTPLSSLMGWIELLKLENVEPTAVGEIENDVNRLKQIAQRFSKIGSQPELKEHDLVGIAEKTYHYLRTRISSGVDFQFRKKDDRILIDCNPELLSWVLENLVRNAVDAMQNRGKIELKVEKSDGKALISIRDNGPGIPSGLQRRIFEPGYTTKKRGWGLGLSLAKRIINDYHKGKIYVAESEKDKGTEFRILLRVK